MKLTYKETSGIKATGAPLSTDLFARLRKDILQGILQPGGKLVEQQVCNQYQVSRTPVREAFKQLELEGLIEIIPNRGAFVIGFSSQDIEDMYELRKSYEILAVKWAILRMSKEDLEELEEAFEFMEFYTQKNDMDKMLNINTNFHQLIYAGAKNKMLMHVLSSYQLYIKQSKVNQIYSDDYLPTILEEHRKIFHAFQNRDVEAGILAMSHHMDCSKTRAK
ncbi:MAG: GntR family transcriptional regulator [Anaerovorax sp.]